MEQPAELTEALDACMQLRQEKFEKSQKIFQEELI